jgi:outer membrane protein
MKTVRRLLPLLLLLAPLAAQEPAAPVAATAPGLTLAQVLDEVLGHYPTIEAARQGIESAKGRTQQSRSAQLPQLTGNASYSYVDPLAYVDFALPGGSSRFYQSVHDNYDGSLNLRQLVTDFGRTDAILKAARAGELSAQDALEQVRTTVGYQTIQYFYAVLYLRESVSVADEELRALQEALRISQQRFSVGNATRFDLLTTQVRLANAENRRTDTIASLRRQEARLRQLLGWDDAKPLALAGTFPLDASPADRAKLLNDAIELRPELKMARHSEQAAQFRFDAADRSNRPTLSASATGGMRNGFVPNLDETRGYLNAGLSLSVPILTGNRTDGQRREARGDLRAAQERTHDLERTAAGDIDAALADLAAAQARLGNSDTLVDQAKEALALAQTRYTAGVVTNFELLDAQSAARSAELSRLQARYDCVIARQSLARAAGHVPAP